MSSMHPLLLLLPSAIVGIIGIALLGVGGAGLSNYTKAKNALNSYCNNDVGYVADNCCFFEDTYDIDYCIVGTPKGNVAELAIGVVLLVVAAIAGAFLFLRYQKARTSTPQSNLPMAGVEQGGYPQQQPQAYPVQPQQAPLEQQFPKYTSGNAEVTHAFSN